jgi:hypothetical protein
VFWHVLVAVSQVSRVHSSPSSQSVSKAQHPDCAVLLQVPVGTSQLSVVQGFESSQSLSPLQQPVTGL